MKGQNIRELAATFSANMARTPRGRPEERRNEHPPESDGFQLWEAIACELRELQSHQLNQPLNKPNAIPVRKRPQ